MRRVKSLTARLERLHEEMAAKRIQQQEHSHAEMMEALSRLSDFEFCEYLRTIYFAAIERKDTAFVEFFEQDEMQWILQDNWKEEGVKRRRFSEEDIA